MGVDRLLKRFGVFLSRGTGMTGKARNLLDQVYVSPEKPVDSGSDFWVEKKAQQDNANRQVAGRTAAVQSVVWEVETEQLYVTLALANNMGYSFQGNRRNCHISEPP